MRRPSAMTVAIAAGLCAVATIAVVVHHLGSGSWLPPIVRRVHRRAGPPATCFANIGRIGKALRLYAQDYDGLYPQGTQRPKPVTMMSFIPPEPSHGCGWAGQVFPYVRDVDAYACPEDRTVAYEPAVPVSYGLNDLVAGPTHPPEAREYRADDRSIVLLFEVGGATACVQSVDEDASGGAESFSAAARGDQLVSGLHDEPGNARFAIGRLNGAWSPSVWLSPRHRGGAFYCMLDGHVEWHAPDQVYAREAPSDGGDRSPPHLGMRPDSRFWRYRNRSPARPKARVFALMDRARSDITNRRFRTAEVTLLATVASYDGPTEAFLLLARAHEMAGDDRAALVTYQRMVRTRTQVETLRGPVRFWRDLAAPMRYAKALARAGRWPEAAAMYDEAIKANARQARTQSDNDVPGPPLLARCAIPAGLPANATGLDHTGLLAAASTALGARGPGDGCDEVRYQEQQFRDALRYKPKWSVAHFFYAEWMRRYKRYPWPQVLAEYDRAARFGDTAMDERVLLASRDVRERLMSPQR